jgi:hypothetical protein
MITTSDYDLKFLYQLTDQVIHGGNHTRLIQEIGIPELLNHLSTTFWTPKALLGLDVTLTPGKTSPLVQAAMQALGIPQLIGFTPLYPRSSPRCGDGALVEECERKLIKLGLRYLPAKGRALDFPDGDGCFLLIGVSLQEAEAVLSDQLSCVVLPAVGEAMLVSLVD